MSTVQRTLMRAILGVLVVVAVGPVGIAMAEPPTVSSIEPASGPAAGGTSVTIKGSGFVTGATVKIGEASEVLAVSETEITAVTAAGIVGDDEVIVADINGTSSSGLFYTYLAPPLCLASPTIEEQPKGQSVTEPSTATFNASASTPEDCAAPSVQWYSEAPGSSSFSPVGGAMSTSYTTSPSTTAESGTKFEAIFTNAAGETTTEEVTLTVNAAPVVTSNPASQGVKVGEAATFTAAASGTPAPDVQWQESTDFGLTWTDDTTDAGNTTGTLTVSPTTVAESGHEYRAVFTNVVTTVPSQPATLTVFAKPVAPVAPSVMSNPVDQTVLAGEGAAFTAAASGTPTPEVQWQVSTDGGSTWANDTTDAGNTTDTLAVLRATVAESGREYRAVFANVVETVTSKAATLTVESPPPVTPPAPIVTPTPGATTTNDNNTTTPPVTSPASPAASPTPPGASFTWAPSDPAAGENVVLASTSTDLDSPISAFAWDLTGSGTFTAGGPVISTSFAAPGDHVVRLQVIDGDGLASVATETIPVAATPLALMQPFPVVRIAGSEGSSGARISLLTVQAPVGTQIEVTCRGHHCPSRSESRVVVATSRGADKAGTVVLTFGRFERSLQAGVVLEIRVSKQGEIGKYTSFAIRSGRLPVRVDACVEPADPEPIPCPAS